MIKYKCIREMKEARNTERYDIAIIGTGPAGVSAALTAKNRNKSILLLGSRQMSEKVAKAHEIRNYPGLPFVKGEDLAAAFRDQLDRMEIPVTEQRIGAVYAMGDYFALQAGEEMLEASTVILATGVVMAKTLPGEEALLGRGVRVCSKVLYFPMYKEQTDLPDTVEVIRETPGEILKKETGLAVKTEAGEYYADGVFVLREAVAPGQLVPGLETDGPHVTVNRRMETNLPGVFACGDLVGTPYQYVKAAGEGNIAAISAATYIDRKNKEKGE